jgi:hypothetical protein
MQTGRTRWTHYNIAYHFVWIPKYRRRILTGEVQAETKRLIAECCERHGITLLARETDEDHIHVFVRGWEFPRLSLKLRFVLKLPAIWHLYFPNRSVRPPALPLAPSAL